MYSIYFVWVNRIFIYGLLVMFLSHDKLQVFFVFIDTKRYKCIYYNNDL